MNAGRELDKLVAENVMGHVPDPTRCDRCGWKLENTPTAGCVKDNCSMRPMPELRGPRPYSTSIEAAWEVVETMKLAVQPVHPYAGRWMAGTKDPAHGGLYWDEVTEAESAPLAICLAALRAKGIAS